MSWEDIGFAKLDTDRERRTGDPEVVYGQGKTPAQIVTALRTLAEHSPGRAVLATRLDPAAQEAIAAAIPGAVIDAEARCARLGPLPEAYGQVVIVSAGTVDGPVAAEAAMTVTVHGAHATVIRDVGVAGLHRLLAVRDRLDAADAPHRGRRHGRRPAQRGRRPDRGTADRRTHLHRLRYGRRRLRRPCCPCSTPAPPASSWSTSTTATAPPSTPPA